MNVEAYIAAVQAKIAARAIDACTRPQGRDAFEYGKVSGQVLGLQEALALLDEQLNPKDPGPVRNNAPATRSANPYTREMDAAPNLPEQFGRR